MAAIPGLLTGRSEMRESNYRSLFTGRKTKARFEEIQTELECKYCFAQALRWEPPENAQQAPGGKLVCSSCGKFQDWLTKEGNEQKRQRGRFNVDRVWAENGNRCGFCGISKHVVERFGIGHHMEVQHVPPLEFAESEDECKFVPICGWCQQNSAALQKRFKHLVKKLCPQFDVKKDENDLPF